MSAFKQVYNDTRTEAEKITHTKAVVAYDPGMSGWGNADKGQSWCGWSYDPMECDENALFLWVKRRGDMGNVQIVDLGNWTPALECQHFMLYVVTPGHVAFKASEE